MTTGITTISQDSFSRIDALLARAREATEATSAKPSSPPPRGAGPPTQPRPVRRTTR